MKIIIPGDPLAKTRHRCGCLHGKPRAYDPQVKAMEAIRAIILEEWNKAFNDPTSEIAIEANSLALVDSFEVSCLFVFTPPRSFNTRQTNRLLWGLDSHNTKPDLDNLAKLYLDCANGIIWRDDAQINLLNIKKIFQNNARTEIKIVAKENLNMDEIEKQILETLSPLQMKTLIGDACQVAIYDTSYTSNLYQAHDAISYDVEYGGLLKSLQKFSIDHADELMKIKKITQKHERQAS